MKRIQEIFLDRKWYFAVLLVIASLSYLVNTSTPGFHWDDWQAVFLYKTQSIQTLLNFFEFDRPLSAFTYVPLFKILSMQPTVWHIVSLLIRCTAVLLLAETFILIWNDHKWALRWFGIILLVFPSFALQSVAVAFNQHFLALLLFSLSLYLMVKALLTTSWLRWVYGVLSLMAAFGHMATMEYFVGLEALRPFLIFAVLTRNGTLTSIKSRVLKTLLLFIPYGITLAGYFYWRFGIFPSELTNAIAEDPNTPTLLYGLKTNFFSSIVALLNLGLQDSVYLITQGWLRPLQAEFLRLDARFNLLSWGIGFVAAVFIAMWLKEKVKTSDTVTKAHFHLPAAIIGLAGIMLGGLPVWSTNRSALVGKWSERFTLAPMIGAVLLIVVLLDWFIDDRRKKNIILTFILGLSIAFQMQTTHRFVNDWEIQRDYYWQIAWRIPAVKPGTGFISGNVPSSNSSHHSASFALNVLYGGEVLSPSAPVWYLRPIDISDIVDNRLKGQPIQAHLRNVIFDGSSSNLIGILNRPSSGCLLILDEAYLGNPLLDATNQNILALSNLEQIDLDAPTSGLDKQIFGKEPEHQWCYYFQKADLARQKKDWNEVTRLMDEAFGSGLDARYSTEYLPLLEAQYNLSDWSGYLETSQKMLSRNTGFEDFVCTQWARIEATSALTPPAELASELQPILDCSQLTDKTTLTLRTN